MVSDSSVMDNLPALILFGLIIASMFVPGVMDVCQLIGYMVWDIGVDAPEYLIEHENGWTFWTLVHSVIAVPTFVLYIFLIEKIVVGGMAAEKLDSALWWSFFIANTTNIVWSMLKWWFITIEWLGLRDLGRFGVTEDNDWGNTYFDIEMWVDLFKVSYMLQNYMFFFLIPFASDYL